MKSLEVSIFVFLLFHILTACGSSKNVYYFYEDGSGKTEAIVDIGAMLEQTKYIFTTGQSESLIEEENGEFDANDLYEYNNFQEEEYTEEEERSDPDNGSVTANIKLFDSVFAGFTDKSKLDTTLVMKDLVPDAILQQLDRPGLLDNIILTANIDQDYDIMILKIEQKFAHISQIRETQTQLEKASAYMGKNDSKPTRIANPNITFDIKERFLYVPADSIINFDYLGGDFYGESITEEQIDKMIEMTGIDKVTTTYHLPYPITSVETESHYILSEDKKSVEVSTDLKTLLKNGHVGSLRLRY